MYMSDKTDSQLLGLRMLGLKLACSGEQEDIVNFWSSVLTGKLRYATKKISNKCTERVK